jgi:hypothetical protein
MVDLIAKTGNYKLVINRRTGTRTLDVAIQQMNRHSHWNGRGNFTLSLDDLEKATQKLEKESTLT